MNRRWRLHTRWTLTLAVSVLIVVLGYGTALYLLVGNDRLAAVDQALRQETMRLASLVKIDPKGIEVESHEHIKVQDAAPAIESLVAAGDGEILQRFPTEGGPAITLELAGPDKPIGEHRFRRVTLNGRPCRAVELRLTGTREHYDKKTYEFRQLQGEVILAAWQDLTGVEAELAGLLQRLVLLGSITVAGAGFLGYFLAGRMLRPISELVQHAEQIEDLSERLPVGRARDELARLAEVINAMLMRLESTGAADRRFLADAAHELRSPLTVLQGEIELALRRPRDTAAYLTVLRACETEIHGLSRLVEGLLFLARADAGTLDGPRELVDLREVVAGCARDGRSIAGDRLRCELPDESEPIPVWGNGALVRRLLMNVVENAIQHGGPQSEIALTLGQQNGHALLRVEDNGPGISPDDVPHIFERFYRGDRARSRANGRVGLSLAIAREIALRHGGQIRASNSSGGGARFEITLPLADVADAQSLSPPAATPAVDSQDRELMATAASIVNGRGTLVLLLMLLPARLLAQDSPGKRDGLAPSAAPSAAGPATDDRETTATKSDRRREPLAPTARVIQFSFASAPWEHVLDWFAELCGLALQVDEPPPGTFNYIHDPRRYTVGEALDVLNAQLAPKGFTLIRKDNYLRLVALQKGIPSDLIPRVSLAELDQRGDSEFVRVLFPVRSVLAKTAADEVAALVGEFGKLVAMDSVNRIMVTDTAGNVRQVRDLLAQIDGGDSILQSKTRVFQLKYTVASKVEVVVRDLLGLPTRVPVQSSRSASVDPVQDLRERMRQAMAQGGGGKGGGPPWMQEGGGELKFRGQDGGEVKLRVTADQVQHLQKTFVQPAHSDVQIAVDDRLNQIFVKGPPDTLALVDEVIAQIDVPRDGESLLKPTEPQTPTMKVYRLASGDTSSLVAALEPVFLNTPGVRLSADPSNNALVAFATPDDHKTIADLIRQLEQEERKFTVLPLATLDAASVAELLAAVYSTGETDRWGQPIPRPGQPRIHADRQNNIVVRGSQKQVDDIRTLLATLGESQLVPVAGNDRLRILPLPPGMDSKTFAEAIQQLWPIVSPNNRIRIIELGNRSRSSTKGPAAGDGRVPTNGRARTVEAPSQSSPATEDRTSGSN